MLVNSPVPPKPPKKEAQISFETSQSLNRNTQQTSPGNRFPQYQGCGNWILGIGKFVQTSTVFIRCMEYISTQVI